MGYVLVEVMVFVDLSILEMIELPMMTIKGRILSGDRTVPIGSFPVRFSPKQFLHYWCL